MDENLQIKETPSTELAVVQTAERQKEVESAIILAKKFERNENKAYEKLIASCQRLKFAEITTYSFPRGGKNIKGPSVNIAREAARCYGNLRYGLDIVQDNQETITIQAWAWDMETNTRVSQEDKFKKLIYRKKGGWVAPDERDLRELVNRRGAIVVRNCLLQIIPKDFIDDALAEAAKTVLSKVNQSPKEQLKSMQTAFKKDFNISVEMLEKFLGHEISECGPEEIVDLRGVYTSLKDGNSKREDYFGKTTKPDVQMPKAKTQNADLSLESEEDIPPQPVPEETEKSSDPSKSDECFMHLKEFEDTLGKDFKKILEKFPNKKYPKDFKTPDLENLIKLCVSFEKKKGK